MRLAHFMRYTRRAAFMTLVTVAGCGGEAEDDMEDMPGMSSTPADGSEQAGDASSAMRSHMERMMSSMMPDSMMAMMPEHRQMVANMLAQMNREMSSMNMASDAAWTATVDSVRADLTSIPEMTATEVAAMMPAHRARVERLMSMHQAMMGRM